VYLFLTAAIFAVALPAMAAPSLTSISPTSGYPGTSVTLNGTAFGATQGSGSVWLGSKLAGSIVSWSNTQIVAVVATGAATGSAQVQQGGTWSNSIAFTVIKPNIISISPTSGYPGSQVTINGTNFGASQGSGSVWLGNKLAGSIVSWSSTQIVAVVDATALSGSVQVQQNTVWGNSVTFTVIQPNITSISPTSGYPGSNVTINGTNFGASQGSGSVWLGNKLAGSIVSWSNTQIVATVAATALSGNAIVQQGGVWSNSIAFTVIQANITSISPTSGYPGTQVTINGTNFGATQGTGSVWLGNQLAGSIVSWSNTQIVATVATTALSGSAQVQQGGVWSNSIAFTVIQPNITSISPTSGITGTQVTITGTNFGAAQGSGSVWLGSKLAGSIVSWSNTQIVATVDSGSITGNAIVQQGGVWSNSVAFTVNTPTLTSVSPATARAGEEITLTGTNFGSTQGSGSVWLGDKLAGSIVSWSATQIVATVAMGAKPGTAQVQQGGVWSNNFAFDVIIPVVTELGPDSGHVLSEVDISGSGFGATQGDGKVWIGTKYATVLAWGDEVITAVVPAGAESGGLQVYRNGVWSNALNFEVTECPVAEDPQDTDGNDVVWIDDDGVPAGTTVGAAGIAWSSYQKMHGTMAFHAVDANQDTIGLRGVSFTGLSGSIATRDTLFLDVLSEECGPAQQIIVTWQTDGGPRTAYWGPNVRNLGPAAVQVSEDPIEPGYWQRLNVDPDDLDLTGRTVTGVTVEHVDGRVWFDYIGVNVPPPCGPPAPDDVSGEFNPLDVVFFEDSFPAGTSVDEPGVVWDTTYHAGGTQSFTHASPDFEQPQTISLTGFNPPFTPHRYDALFVWVLIDGCEIPRQLKVTWKTSTGNKVVWYGSQGDVYGTGGVYGGNMPQAGQWRRLSVNVNAFPNYTGSVHGVVLENYGGHVWWDHAGRTTGNGCLEESWQNRPNTLHNDDELWIDEAFPAGATVDGSGWVWSDRQRSTNDLSFNYPDLNNHQPQHISVQGFTPVPIDPNGFLFAYVFQNSCNPPEEILLTWETSAGPKSAYWGANPYNSTGVSMGPLPRLRAWERLEVPASLLGIEEGDTVTGFTIDQYRGQAFYDTIGARPECTLTELPPATDFRVSDTIWIEDETPAGFVAHDVDFTSDQKTSGSTSFTSTDGSVTGVHTLSFDFPANYLGSMEGDSILLYVLLDPCNPPRQIAFKFTYPEGYSRASFGDSIIPGGSGGGPLPGSDGWQRVQLPFSSLGLQFTNDLVNLEISTVGGRAWFDHLGKSCFVAPMSQNMPVDEEDVLWFEGELPAESTATPGIVWEPERNLNGISSFTSVNASTYGTHTIAISDLPPQLIGPDDALVFYAHTDHCPPASQIQVTWHLESGQTRSAWWGGTSGTGHHGGDIVLGWGHYFVPATTLNMVGERVVGITFVNEGGRASFNHVGVNAPACFAATATAPVIPPGDEAWFEDSWSASAPQYTEGRWDTRQHASGTAAITSDVYGQYYSGIIAAQNFTGTPPSALQAGGEVVMWVFIDPCDIPQFIQVQWTTSLGDRTFYWGSFPHIFGTYMGPLPAAGYWARLAMPVDAELDGAIPTSILASWYSAKVWFDHIGATTGACIATPDAPTLPTAAQIWMDDEVPPSSTGSTGPFVTNQHASGTHSLRLAGAGQQSFVISVPPWTVGPSESLAFTMLVDPCAETPQEIVVSWMSVETGEWLRAFWGTDLIGSNGSSHNLDMGSIPATNEWHVIEIDPALLGLGTDGIIGLRVETVGGRVWFDRFGTHAP
jgi:hypothetical protein